MIYTMFRCLVTAMCMGLGIILMSSGILLGLDPSVFMEVVNDLTGLKLFVAGIFVFLGSIELIRRIH